MHVVILHDDVPPDARADEQDVFVQAQAVEAALREIGHSTSREPFSLDLSGVSTRLKTKAPDLIFNLVEAVGGQGRLIYLAPALLDALRLPYTGAATEAMFLTSHKVLAKQYLRACGLPTPDWFCPTGPRGGLSPAGQRVIIKSVWEEASVGLEDDAVMTISDPTTLREAVLARAHRLDGDAFAEQYVEGREFNLSLLAGADGPQVLPPAEIEFVDYPPQRPRLVGYRAKWDPDSFEYLHTPRRFDFPPRDARLLAELGRLARVCWELFGLRGYARVDFRVDAEDRPWILEVNANPCLSPDAGFVAAAGRAGLSGTDVARRIVSDALEVSSHGKREPA